MSLDDLSDLLLGQVVGIVEALATHLAPGLRLPRIDAGHLVTDDAKVDAIEVFSRLIAIGIDEIHGVSLRHTVWHIATELAPERIDGFWSFRMAESIQRLGGLGVVPSHLLQSAIEASTPTRLFQALKVEDPLLRANFRVVAARCLMALEALQPGTYTVRLAASLADVAVLLWRNDSGWINDGLGWYSQYDIYTPEIYVLAQPMRTALEPIYTHQFRHVLSDLAALSTRGGAVTWGRSTGPLALAMSVQLSAAAAEICVPSEAAAWVQRGAQSAAALRNWFVQGLITAHNRRATDSYRSISRRIQMSLDICGKLLSASQLLSSTSDRIDKSSSQPAWPALDRFIEMAEAPFGAVWSFRSPSLSFIIPFMFGESVSYLPSPRMPYLFEQPPGSPPVMLPILLRSTFIGFRPAESQPLVPAGKPIHINHRPGRLAVEYIGWAPVGETADHPDALGGSRTAVYEVNGRTLTVSETVRIASTDDATTLAILIPDTGDSVIDVSVTNNGEVLSAATDGTIEWRSSWSEHQNIKQITFSDPSELRFIWTLRPQLRIASTDIGHQYSTSLYETIKDQACIVDAG